MAAWGGRGLALSMSDARERDGVTTCVVDMAILLGWIALKYEKGGEITSREKSSYAATDHG